MTMSIVYDYAYGYGGTAAMPVALWLCLWPYGYHYGAYVYDPMPLVLCL